MRHGTCPRADHHLLPTAECLLKASWPKCKGAGVGGSGRQWDATEVVDEGTRTGPALSVSWAMSWLIWASVSSSVWQGGGTIESYRKERQISGSSAMPAGSDFTNGRPYFLDPKCPSTPTRPTTGDPESDHQPDLEITELKDLENTFSLCDCVVIECCINYSTYMWVIVYLSYCFSVFTCEFI